ncbi:MAG: porin family protein [Rhodospirillales bacterium]|nr:porin family protein [Rhodospirillales bacterium]
MNFQLCKITKIVSVFIILMTFSSNKSESAILLASMEFIDKPATISDMRVGNHPDKTRLVFDVSHPTNLAYTVSDNGTSLKLSLPKAVWVGTKEINRIAGGNIAKLKRDSNPKSTNLTITSRHPIRVKNTFFLQPNKNKGHRIVVDIAKSSLSFTKLSKAVTSDANIELGVRSNSKIEIAQAINTGNPYIQRAFPRKTKKPTASEKMTKSYQEDKSDVVQNLYARGSIGLSMFNETSTLGGKSDFDAEFEPGFILNGAIGMKLENNFRAEGEFLFSQSSLKQISGTSNGITHNTENVSGDLSALALMGNAILDIPMNSRATPYAMAGAGLTALSLNDFQASNISLVDDMDWVLAFQIGGGISLELDRKTDIEIGYRYFESQDPEFSDVTTTPFKSNFSGHNFLIGAKVNLN